MSKFNVGKILVCGIILLFVGASIIPSMSGTTVEKQIPKENKSSFMGFNPRGDILYVGGSGPNNYTTIQSAIDDAVDGDTVFVYSGMYYEKMEIINKSIHVIGENKESTIIDVNRSSCGLIILADNCTIEGFTFRNGDPGIYIVANSPYNISCSNNIIRNNIIQNNTWGILVLVITKITSSNNVFSENILTNNEMRGICILGVHGPTHNTTIIGNTITNHDTGVYILNSTGNNTISDNIITDSTDGIRIHTGGNGNSIQRNIITNDIEYPGSNIQGMDIYYIYNTDISANYIENMKRGIQLTNGYNITLAENTIIFNANNSTDIGDGMRISELYDSNISWNAISNFYRGIHLNRCINVTIYMNDISNCTIPLFVDGGVQIQRKIATRNLKRNSQPNSIIRNNFLQNKLPPIFVFRVDVPGIVWSENYWGRPRILPKLIIGFKILGEVLPVPARIQLDWRPAKEPYVIPRVAV